MEKHWNGHSWKVHVLNADEGTVSVLCLDPAMDDRGIDQTNWPSDAEVSEAVRFPVRWLDAGDSPDGVEGIYCKGNEDK